LCSAFGAQPIDEKRPGRAASPMSSCRSAYPQGLSEAASGPEAEADLTSAIRVGSVKNRFPGIRLVDGFWSGLTVSGFCNFCFVLDENFSEVLENFLKKIS